MKKINLLPEHIIDQIKAGEVIERPSTLIKEIIENSIDAGSKNIELQLINNGMDLISLIDDGHGISKSELPLAFCRHATSKIERFEDLYTLYSYGFRGEALASIASISRINCESTDKDGNSSLIKIEGGQIITHTDLGDMGLPSGTKLFIKDLFYNTPVRMKFLQSKTSERNHLRKIINSFLLIQPNIRFSIKWDEQEKENYPIESELEKRIQKVIFKKNQNQKMISFSQDYDGISVRGFVSEDSSRGSGHKANYIFVNNRYIQDIAIHKIILNNAASLWPFGEVGQYVVYIDLPPEQLDVNVHPNKTIVKIFEASKVQSIVSGGLKKALHTYSKPIQRDQPNNSQESFDQSPTDFFKSIEDEKSSIDFKSIHYKTVDESIAENNFYKKEIEYKSESLFIGETFYLYRNSNRFFLINLEELLKNLFTAKFKKPQAGANLLISIPFKDKNKKIDPLFEDLFNYGYELDRLDTSTVAIRAVPFNSNIFNHADIFEKISNHNKNITKLETFLKVIEEITFDIKNITPNSLEKILEELSLAFLIEKNIAKELNDINLRKLFHG